MSKPEGDGLFRAVRSILHGVVEKLPEELKAIDKFNAWKTQKFRVHADAPFPAKNLLALQRLINDVCEHKVVISVTSTNNSGLSRGMSIVGRPTDVSVDDDDSAIKIQLKFDGSTYSDAGVDRGLEYWIRALKTHIGSYEYPSSTEVFVVGTHADAKDESETKAQRVERLKEIKQRTGFDYRLHNHEVSTLTYEGIKELRNDLLTTMSKLSTVSELIPDSYMAVVRTVRKLAKEKLKVKGEKYGTSISLHTHT